MYSTPRLEVNKFDVVFLQDGVEICTHRGLERRKIDRILYHMKRKGFNLEVRYAKV